MLYWSSSVYYYYEGMAERTRRRENTDEVEKQKMQELVEIMAYNVLTAAERKAAMAEVAGSAIGRKLWEEKHGALTIGQEQDTLRETLR